MSALLYRVGGLTVRWRFAVFALWVLLAIGLSLAVARVGAETDDNLSLPGTDSQSATDLLAARFPPQQNGKSPIVFRVSSGKVTDPKNSQVIDAAHKAIKSLPHTYSAVSPFSDQGAGQVSKDGRTAFIPVLLDIGSGDLTEEEAAEVLAAAEPARKADMEVAAGGSIGSELSKPETGSSDKIGILAAMLILSVVLGTLVAMSMPILTAVIALMASLAALGLLGHVVAIPSVGPTLATMIGLGVGIDYALFLVTRHQHDLAEGMDVPSSISRTVATLGTAVVFAGGTVVIALLALAVAGIPLVTSLGYGAAVAVVSAVVSAVTLLPALMAIAGRRIGSMAMPAFLRLSPVVPGRGIWAGWARFVTHHPWVAVTVSAVVLGVLAIPVFSLTLGQEDIGSTPTSTTERQAYDMLSAGFGVGYNGPLLIATSLGSPAKPSTKVQNQENQLQKLQNELKKEQAQGDQMQAELEAEGADLKADQQALLEKQAALERQQEELLAEQANLESQAAELQAQESRLRIEAEQLAQQARPIAIHLFLIRAHERRLERRIQNTTDPVLKALLQQRLQRLERREQRVAARLAPLQAKARRLLAQAEELARQAAVLEQEKSSLEAQGAALQQQAAALQAQGAALEQRKDELDQQKAQLLALQKKAAKQQKQAEQLKNELTKELTKAGGDDRGTDPRLVNLQDALAQTDGVALVSPPQINTKGNAAIYSAIATTAPAAPETADLVRTLRSSVIPGAIGDSDLTAYVGGSTAANVDLAAEIAARLPLVIAVVLALSFIVLMIAFRSLLVPLQAAAINMAAVAAAFGVLTATFQWGWGISLIGVETASDSVPIASFVPLMMFAVLFGLSMDYQVFILSQIGHHRARGEDDLTAVASGLATAGRVITTAALIMVCVFGSFILNGDPIVKQFGVGLAVAVALAATMVLTLTPAVLVLFGHAAWWFPDRLGHLVPRVDIEGEALIARLDADADTSAAMPEGG